MLKNYFVSALRNIFKHKTFSVINILGLTGGITACLLIFTLINDELSYDNFHSKGDRIYRVKYDVRDFQIARIPPVMASHITSFFPEVETTARMYVRSVSVQVDDGSGNLRRFEEPNVNFADSSLFQIFDFETVSGQLENPLHDPFTVILNEEIATKYFGDKNPIGQSILMEGNNSFEVIAVVKDFPSNSHTHFDLLVPYDNMYDLEPESMRETIRANFQTNWVVSHSPTYVLLNEGANPARVNEEFPNFITEKIPEAMQMDQTFSIQPLSEIHLNDDVQAQAEPSGSKELLFIFGAVGLLTILIACINFINLSTARSLQRAKEIGMRKVLGAWKTNLIIQFLGESFLTTFFATSLAYGVSFLLIPQFNELTGKTLEATVLFEPVILVGCIILFVLTGFIAGIYPAFFVTKIAPITSIKGEISTKAKGGLAFRKGLVVFQFAISMILIASTLIVFDQLNMMRSAPLGFKKENIITLPIQSQNFNNVFGGVDEALRQKMNAFEESIQSIPGVTGSTVSAGVPGFGMVNRNVIPEGFTAEDNLIIPVYAIDYDFIETYEIDIISGRDLSKEFGTDELNAFIINESAVTDWEFGSPEEALGKTINLEGREGRVVGVVKDFNFLSFTFDMRPLILNIAVSQFSAFSIKLANKNMPETMERLEATWNEFFPNETFDASFLDESLDDRYNQQDQFGTTVGYFSILAILISCLGSYGLIMFVASQKVKKIGIRKVLGASINNILMILSKRFIVLSLVSLVLSVPVTLWFANDWPETFTYRVTVSPITFIIAGLSTLVLVMLTIGFHAIKAATSNPVKSLRSE